MCGGVLEVVMSVSRPVNKNKSTSYLEVPKKNTRTKLFPCEIFSLSTSCVAKRVNKCDEHSPLVYRCEKVSLTQGDFADQNKAVKQVSFDSVDVGSLPNAHGFGVDFSLHKAILKDDRGYLEALVKAFLVSVSHEDKAGLVEEIVFFWSSLISDQSSNLAVAVEKSKIDVIEFFYGYKVGEAQGVGVVYNEVNESLFRDVVDCVFYQLSSGSYLHAVFQNLSWQKNLEENIWTSNFRQWINYICEQASISNTMPEEDFFLGVIQSVQGLNVYTFAKACNFRSVVDDYIQAGHL